MSHLNRTLIFRLLLLAGLLSACGPAPSTQVAPTSAPAPTQAAANPTPTLSAAASRPVLKTAAGDFVIQSIRWIDENTGTKPGSDEKTLLITLGKTGQQKLDLSNFSADGFVKALRDVEVRITWADGSFVVCTTAGWVGDANQEFGITVHIPRSATKLQLFWPGNPPVELIPGNQEKP